MVGGFIPRCLEKGEQVQILASATPFDKYLMKISELLKAPTIVSATTKSGEIDRKKADRIEDPRGYFSKASSYYSKKPSKKK